MINTPLLVGLGLALLGLFLLIRPSYVAEKLQIFYGSYPLARYLVSRQPKSRASFVVALGIVFLGIGLFGVVIAIQSGSS